MKLPIPISTIYSKTICYPSTSLFLRKNGGLGTTPMVLRDYPVYTPRSLKVVSWYEVLWTEPGSAMCKVLFLLHCGSRPQNIYILCQNQFDPGTILEWQYIPAFWKIYVFIFYIRKCDGAKLEVQYTLQLAKKLRFQMRRFFATYSFFL